MPYTANKFSRVTFMLCALVMCFASFVFYPRWQNKGSEATISWDVSGYYWYLPSVFIYHDLAHQSFKDSVFNKYNVTQGDFQQARKLDNGNYVLKYSSGMAIMYLPFFTAAHLVAGSLGYPRDGFSAPYQFAIQLGGLLVALLGLWYLRKLLLLYYKDSVVAITLILLVFGSNYLNYASIDVGMSHSWLFTLYVFLLLNTHYFYQTFKVKYAVRIGLLVGLATLTRPTDLLSAIIPLLWGLESLAPAAIQKHLAILLKNYRALIIAGICAAIVYIIQPLYWHHVSGHWVVYSYENQHLYFRSPNFSDYTFSYKSGWLIYSPLLILAFIGIIPFAYNGRNKVAIIAFFLLNYYIVCAWSIWSYGGRAMIQSYPVLFFCIAALIDFTLRRRWVQAIFIPIVLVFIYFNIWITYAYHKDDIYDTECMTKSYFWKVAGRWHAPGNTVVLRDNPDLFEGVPKKPEILYHNNFAKETGGFFISGIAGNTLRLDKDHDLSPMFSFPYSGHADWLRATATFHCEVAEHDRWKMAQFIVRLMQGHQIAEERMIRIYRLLDDNDTKQISIDIRLPHIPFDSVSILFWNGGSDRPLWINNVQAEIFNAP